MSHDKPMEGVRAVIPDDDIIAIGLAFPRHSTIATAGGMALGGLAGGLGTGSATGWGTSAGEVVGAVAGRAASRAGSELPPSVVLAVSATTVYALGRSTSAAFGSWDDLELLMRFDRATLDAEHHHSGALTVIRLADRTHGQSLEVEAKLVGNLDIKHVLAELDRA